jgi:hypothetical protein
METQPSTLPNLLMSGLSRRAMLLAKIATGMADAGCGALMRATPPADRRDGAATEAAPPAPC